MSSLSGYETKRGMFCTVKVSDSGLNYVKIPEIATFISTTTTPQWEQEFTFEMNLQQPEDAQFTIFIQEEAGDSKMNRGKATVLAKIVEPFQHLILRQEETICLPWKEERRIEISGGGNKNTPNAILKYSLHYLTNFVSQNRIPDAVLKVKTKPDQSSDNVFFARNWQRLIKPCVIRSYVTLRQKKKE